MDDCRKEVAKSFADIIEKPQESVNMFRTMGNNKGEHTGRLAPGLCGAANLPSPVNFLDIPLSYSSYSFGK